MEPRSLNQHFEGIRSRAGLPPVRLHDFRHTVVSLLLELGTPPHVVQQIARHADVDVTLSIYAHTNLAAMREALTGRVGRAMSRPHCYIVATFPLLNGLSRPAYAGRGGGI